MKIKANKQKHFLKTRKGQKELLARKRIKEHKRKKQLLFNILQS